VSFQSRAAGSCPFCFRAAAGFSLVELVTVIVLVSIVAVVVAPNMNLGFASARGFYDRTVTLLRDARKIAIAQRRPVFVRIDGAAGTVLACYSSAGACLSPPVPPGVSGWALAAPSGVSVGPTVTLQFDALGRYLTAAGADPGASLAVTIAGSSTYTANIERETGYVYN
jgi:MSHA pilin protein MshC